MNTHCGMMGLPASQDPGPGGTQRVCVPTRSGQFQDHSILSALQGEGSHPKSEDRQRNGSHWSDFTDDFSEGCAATLRKITEPSRVRVRTRGLAADLCSTPVPS